jgi:hypothetical protein
LAILGGLNAILAVAAFSVWRGERSARDTYAKSLAQLSIMQLDASRILDLRAAPKKAAMRGRTNQELLAQLEAAVDAAGVSRDHWTESIPQPMVRLAKSDYKQQTTRCFFESVTLRDLATLTQRLQERDSTIQVSGLNLTNRQPEVPAFDAELAFSYLVYSPLQQQVGSQSASAGNR